MTKPRSYWLIRGYDGDRLFYQREIDGGQLMQSQVKPLLRSLVGRAGLNFDEIVGAYAKRGTKIANNMLEVLKEGSKPIFTCGTSPHFIAALRRR